MKRINKYMLFSFIIAFIFLLFTSKNSFLYVFNDWVDANSFFTVGKGMINGLLPYKDLFDQKGPLLYLIYGIGYLFSHKTYHGVFILEVISFTIFLYYIHKIFIMYFKEKYSLLLLPSISMITCIAIFFVHGGSCEELCLPFIAVSLYYYFKHFKKERLTNKEIIINGFMAGLVFMMKYTLLGFWIGFCLFICINYLRKKEFKKMINFCLLFLLGMIIPFILFLLYFLINNGVKEFIDTYFIFNMTAYSSDVHGIKKIFGIFKYIFELLIAIKPLGFVLILSLILSFLTKEKNKLFRVSLVFLTYISLFFICFGAKAYIYYLLPIFSITIVLIILFGVKLIKKYIDLVIDTKIMLVFSFVFIIILVFMSYFFANYKEEIKYTKKDYVQYKYAEYLSKYKNPTLLNMGFIDMGLYTTSGIIPNTRYFELINVSYEDYSEIYDEMENYVKNKEVDFIVYIHYDSNLPPAQYIYDNYELVYRDDYTFEHSPYQAFLFKVKK